MSARGVCGGWGGWTVSKNHTWHAGWQPVLVWLLGTRRYSGQESAHRHICLSQTQSQRNQKINETNYGVQGHVRTLALTGTYPWSDRDGAASIGVAATRSGWQRASQTALPPTRGLKTFHYCLLFLSPNDKILPLWRSIASPIILGKREEIKCWVYGLLKIDVRFPCFTVGHRGGLG